MKNSLVIILTAILIALLVVNICTLVAHAEGYTIDDSYEAIHLAAVRYDVSERTMLRVAICESDLRPWARGDWRRGIGPTAFGLYQISALEDTGLLEHFHWVTGASAFNPYASARYFARVLRGDFADDGITAYRWSCY